MQFNRILNWMIDDRGWVIHHMDAYTDHYTHVGFMRIHYIPHENKFTLDKYIDTILGIHYPVNPERHIKSYNRFVDYHVDKPAPSYVELNDEFRNLGLASEIYLAARGWMASIGLGFWSSDVLNRHSGYVWRSFEQKGMARKLDKRYVFID